MPRQYQRLGQFDWGGGMNEKEPRNNQARFLKNVVIRSGKPQTRPGIRRKWRSTSVGSVGFSFPFTFPFTFVSFAWGDIQGVGKYRFTGQTDYSFILVSAGTVYTQSGPVPGNSS